MTIPRTGNWAGNVTYRATRIHTPTSMDELRRIVAGAGRVRALGTRHSFSTVADTGDELLSLAAMPAGVEIAAEGGSATVSAGMRYGEVAETLDTAGYALHNLGSLPHISVAGAVATGTHGSGVTNGNLSTAVSGIELVTAGGEVRWIRRGDPGFGGAVVSLGALGVVTRLTLGIEPAYQAYQVVYEDLPFEGFDPEIFTAGYSVSLFTTWADRRFSTVWVKRRGTADDAPATVHGARRAGGPRHPINGVDPSACTDQLGAPGPWHRRLPHFRLDHTPSVGEELQSEYFVDRADAPAAVEAVAALADLVAPLLAVTELRTVAADELWLSPAYRRDSLAVHFTWKDDVPGVTAALPEVEAALAPFAPRPHWGKLFTMAPARVAACYERIGDFGRLRRELDPAGTFGNEFVDAYAPASA